MKYKQCGVYIKNDDFSNAIDILDKIINAMPNKRNYQEHELDQSMIDIMFPDSNDMERLP